MLVHFRTKLAAVPQEQRHVATIDVMQGYAQLTRQHRQGVAVYTRDDAAA
jgi:hypothetical protein